jgi:hypothetical protein
MLTKLQHVLKERESLNKTILPYTLSTRCKVKYSFLHISTKYKNKVIFSYLGASIVKEIHDQIIDGAMHGIFCLAIYLRQNQTTLSQNVSNLL